jgi:FkbM family methyltransferase
MSFEEIIKNNNHKTVENREYLNTLHSKIKLLHGSLMEEYPEQLLAAKYINPGDVVLEIGGNVGRNSCVIATILKDSKNLVVIESDPENSKLLKENRDNNDLNFNIEECAISNVELYQKEWVTKPINEIYDIENWKKVETRTWEEIKNNYNIDFNILVVDCEGALFYILKENPNFLKTFKKIIIENDFVDINHKIFVDKEFIKNNFERVYYEAGGFGRCYQFFYEVWEQLI